MKLQTTARTTAIFTSVILMAGAGCATMRATQAAGDPDEFFMVEAAQNNLAEIAAGELAVERGGDAVKQYGQRMIDDHTRAQNELMSLAERKGVKLPARPDEQHMVFSAHLRELAGAEFDREFIGHMHGDHAKVVTMFEDKAKNAQDPELRAWAAKMVPILQEHLRLASAMQQAQPNVGM